MNGLVFQLAEVVWNPLRPSYFADDLVHTQQLGIGAAQRCEHVLKVLFLARLGFSESNRGRHEDAIGARTTAIEKAIAFGNDWVHAAALSTRARALTTAGKPRAALDDLGRALELDEQRGSRRNIGLRHRRIGQAYAHSAIADFVQAIWHVRESAAMMEALGDQAAHMRVITYLAETHVHAGQPDAMLFTLRRIDDRLTSCGSPRYRSHAYTVMGRAHAKLGNLVEADRCYDNALTLLADSGLAAATDREVVLRLRQELAAAAGTHAESASSGKPDDGRSHNGMMPRRSMLYLAPVRCTLPQTLNSAVS